MNKWLIPVPILISLCLTGCSTLFDSVSNVYTGPDHTLSSVPAIVQKDAAIVGKAYGEPRPIVTNVVHGTTIDNSTDMYRVTIKGHFIRKENNTQPFCSPCLPMVLKSFQSAIAMTFPNLLLMMKISQADGSQHC